jgi:RNA polymerase sigma factor (sigma-70 family)
MNAVEMRAAVLNEAQLLELEQFRHPDDEAERARINAIRALALEQLADDVYTTGGPRRERIGGQWVAVYDEFYGERPLWTDRTEEEEALAEGLAPFLDRLPAEQRVLVRMRYDAQMTEQEVAALTGTTQQAVHQRLATVHKALREVLLAAFAPPEEVEAGA